MEWTTEAAEGKGRSSIPSIHPYIHPFYLIITHPSPTDRTTESALLPPPIPVQRTHPPPVSNKRRRRQCVGAGAALILMLLPHR